MLNWDNEKDVFLKALLDSPIGVRFSDKDGRIVQVNESYCNMLGFETSEVIGLLYFELIPKEYRKQEIELYNRIWNDGSEYKSILKKRRQDGTFIDLEGTFQLVDVGQERLMMTLYHDISEKTRMQELMNKMGSQAKLGAWERDLISDEIIWTDEIFKIYEIEEGVIPRFGDDKLLDFFDEKELKKLTDNHDHTIKTGERTEVVIRFTSATGEKKWVKNTTDVLFIDEKPAKLFGTFQDVTEQTNREHTLRQTQEFYKLMFHSNPNPIFLIKNYGDYEVVDVNKAAEVKYGYNREELYNSSIALIRPKEERHLLKKVIRMTNEKGNFFSNYGPVTHVTKNGKRIQVQVYWNLVQVGSETMRLIMTHDITQEEQNRNRIEEINQFLSTLIDSSPVAIITLDGDGKVVLYNKKAEHIFGWNEEEVVGDYLPYILRDGHKKYQYTLERALNSKEPYVVELNRRNKDNKLLNLRFHVAPLKADTSLNERVMIIIEDITERKKAKNALLESEQNYRDLVEASTDLIWKQNKSGKLLFVNKKSALVIGYDPQEMVGRNFSKFIEKDTARYFKILSKKVLNGESFENFDLLIKHKNGSQIHFIATVYPTYDAKGNIIGCTGTAGDVTHIIEYQKQLEDSLKEKEILIKEIHHRVKNNLSVLSGLLMLQSKKLDDENAREAFEKSQARIKSIATVHEKLYQNEVFTWIEIKSYLEQLTNDIKSSSSLPGDNIEIKVIGDEVNLSMNHAVPFGILANELIINAYKYAFKGRNKGLITLIISEDGGEVMFRVSDDGIGLPEDFTDMKKGSLGMTLVHSLTEQLEGELDITSNKGTTFTLTFRPDMK